MNHSAFIQKPGLIVALALTFGSAVAFAEERCQLSETRDGVVALVRQYGSPDDVKAVEAYFDEFHLESHGVAQEGDASLPNKTRLPQCHRSLEKLGIDGMVKIFDGIAAKFQSRGELLQGTPAGNELCLIAKDIRAMIQTFKAHLTKYPKAALWPLQMNELRNNLAPFKYLMPIELERPHESNGQLKEFWTLIIKKLCPTLR